MTGLKHLTRRHIHIECFVLLAGVRDLEACINCWDVDRELRRGFAAYALKAGFESGELDYIGGEQEDYIENMERNLALSIGEEPTGGQHEI